MKTVSNEIGKAGNGKGGARRLAAALVAMVVAFAGVGCGGGGGGGGGDAWTAPSGGTSTSGGGGGRTDPVLRVLSAGGEALSAPVALAEGMTFLVEWDAGTTGLYNAEVALWDAGDQASRGHTVLERNCNLSGVTDCNGAVGLYACQVWAGSLRCAEYVEGQPWAPAVHLATWVFANAPTDPVLRLRVCDALFTDCRTDTVSLDLDAFDPAAR